MTATPPAAAGRPRLTLPRVPGNLPGATQIDQAFSLIELADGDKLRQGAIAAMPALWLQAPTGETVALSVTVAGGTPTLHLGLVGLKNPPG